MINVQVNPEFTKQLDIVIDSLQKLNSINAVIKEVGIPFMRPPTLKYEDISEKFNSLAKTDLQKFKAFYNNLGIDYEIIGCNIVIRQQNNKIVGDDSLFSVIEFDENEKFINQGFYEE